MITFLNHVSAFAGPFWDDKKKKKPLAYPHNLPVPFLKISSKEYLFAF